MQPSHDRQAQEREHADPEEAIRPMPLLAVGVTLAMVVFGVLYIFWSEPLDASRLGDQRTVADLAGPAAPAAGAVVDGKALFAAQCAACHQATGKGLPGVFPPLDASEWVTGDTRVLANILLHGINGEITVAGTKYQGSMPAFAQLSDDELAGVASFIRSSWSNQAEAVTAELFAKERAASDRKTPFEGGAALQALTAQ